MGDGAVLRVPPQRGRVTIALGRPPLASQRDQVFIDNVEAVLFPPGDKERPAPALHTYGLAGTGGHWDAPQDHDRVAAALAPYTDPCGNHRAGGHPRVTVYGTAPDGRRVAAHTIQYDDDPARMVALLSRADGSFHAVGAGFVDPTAPLWLRVRLPDGRGVLVVAPDAGLRYRVHDGQWQSAGRDAALLPADATEVEVTRAGRPPATVPLS